MWMFPLLMRVQDQDAVVTHQKSLATAFYAEMSRGLRDIEPSEVNTAPASVKLIDHRAAVPNSLVLRFFSFERGNVIFLPESKMIRASSFGEPISSLRYYPENRNTRGVLDSEAQEVARRFYRLSGGQRAIDPWIIKDGQGTNGLDLQVDYVATHGGIPFHRIYGGYVHVDRLTGRAHSFYASTEENLLPVPPVNLSPTLGQAVAEGVAGRTVASTFGGWLALRQVQGRNFTHLCIWKPYAPPEPARVQFLTNVDHASAARNEGRLVYFVGLDDQSSSRQSDGEYRRSYNAVVDARTGAVLEIERFPELLGGPGGGSGGAATSPLWPTGVRSWRLARSGGGAWRGPVRSKLTPTSARMFDPEHRVVLQSGGIAFRAEFDSERGLLGVRVGERHSFARPNAALLAALRRAIGGER